MYDKQHIINSRLIDQKSKKVKKRRSQVIEDGEKVEVEKHRQAVIVFYTVWILLFRYCPAHASM